MNNKFPRFVKYLKIPYLEEDRSVLSQEVYLFEKLDGALTQVRNFNELIIGGSKANYLTGKIVNYSWFPNFLKWMRSNHSLCNLPEDIVMYGEWLVPVTIDYDKENINKFYFIDLAYVGENGKPQFYDYLESINYLCEWGIKDLVVLPPLKKSLFTDEQIREIKDNSRSQLREGNMEGLVLKNYYTKQFAKTLNFEYSELRENEKRLENKYLTLARVKKAVRRLHDEELVKLPSLGQIVEEVVRDIKDETSFDFDKRAIKAIIRLKGYY